jgi:CheY-like chemotaxis protein
VEQEQAYQIKTALVLDDDDNYRELVLLTLEDHCGIANVLGFDAAAPLLEYLAQPGQAEPDLLVLDLHLGGCTGLEVLQRLRARGVQAPAAFLTGAGDSRERQACLDAGAVAVLVKPVDYDEITRTLQDLTAAVRLSRAGSTGSAHWVTHPDPV